MEALRLVAEEHKLEHSCPDHSKIAEPRNFINIHEYFRVVLSVIVHEVVGILDLFVGMSAIVDQQKDVDDKVDGEGEGEVENGVVYGAGKGDVLVVLLEG